MTTQEQPADEVALIARELRDTVALLSMGEWVPAIGRISRAADLIESQAQCITELTREMHSRELHHFEQEQEAAAAEEIIEKAKESRRHPFSRVNDVDRILDSAPSAALAEVKAQVWDEGAVSTANAVMAAWWDDQEAPRNPYRQEADRG